MADGIVNKELRGFVAELQTTHGENLASIVLYGSAAAGNGVEPRSDYNLLISLRRITPADLRAAQTPMRNWQRLGHPLPVYFTVEELANAADVFPIEFRQMQDARVLLFGQDPFDVITLSDTNLRTQTEYELRTKLIELRRRYIPASVAVDKLCNLMSDSLSSFAALFRGILTLHGKEAPVARIDCVRATVALLDLAGEPFEKIFGFRAAGAKPVTEKEADAVFAAYMDQIERVIEVVDHLKSKTQAPGSNQSDA